MATYSKEFFTGSAADEGGTGIALAVDSGAFTTIHTTTTTAATLDEIWMYAVNSHSADLKVTIQFGGDQGGGIEEVRLIFKTVRLGAIKGGHLLHLGKAL